MIDMAQLLEVRFEISSTFSDYKLKLGQAGRDTVTATLADSDYVYIGYYKKINTLYIDLPTPNTEDATLGIEYWNGTAWTARTGIDETEGFSRSGFLQLDPETDWASNTVDSTEAYWTRLSLSAESSESVFNFVGLVFSDDSALEWENPYVNDAEMKLGQSSHLGFHIAARDAIIRKLQSRSYYKISDGERTDITAWDLLDIQQVRQASIYLTLSKIYFNLSDAPEDHWLEKSDRYYQKYEESLKLAFITLDFDDDGVVDSAEKLAIATNRRLWR